MKLLGTFIEISDVAECEAEVSVKTCRDGTVSALGESVVEEFDGPRPVLLLRCGVGLIPQRLNGVEPGVLDANLVELLHQGARFIRVLWFELAG